MPDIHIQARAARETALLTTAPELGVLVVKGADRVTWLNGLLTCELAKSKPGDVVYGLAVAKNGRILADLFCVLDDALLALVVPRVAMVALRESLDRHLIMEDVDIEPGEDTFAACFVDGPRSQDVLDRARACGAIGGVADFGGAGGALLLVPSSATDGGVRARAGIDDALSSVSGVLGDDASWDALRIERGRPRFGAEFDGATYPQEAGLEKRAVSFSKGCYLGQEVVCMLEMRGHVKRKIVTLVVDGLAVPARGTKVTDEAGVEVGEVTSAAMAPTHGGAVALAMVKRAYAEPGKGLRVGGTVAHVAGAGPT